MGRGGVYQCLQYYLIQVAGEVTVDGRTKMAKAASDKVDNTKEAKQEGEGRAKALDLALETIEKQFGKGSIMKLGENQGVEVECTPTGSLSLDLALGGGIPKGRIIEIYGPESSGKLRKS